MRHSNPSAALRVAWRVVAEKRDAKYAGTPGFFDDFFICARSHNTLLQNSAC